MSPGLASASSWNGPLSYRLDAAASFQQNSCHPGDFCHRFPDARCRFNKGRLGWWTPYGQEVIGLC
ncbi:hypothetical protein GBAR_LOCUS18216 [Geodia barretti]|uniref:Uncharacterized protein n=1 Tax=Geodia barretti TaxID=519541 RepID=A0AA35SL87_GEOBA|nr:hypothetical protein GBAR_LOCUS18216 [Geodia barretti]